jgi:hypothetical protein
MAKITEAIKNALTGEESAANRAHGAVTAAKKQVADIRDRIDKTQANIVQLTQSLETLALQAVNGPTQEYEQAEKDLAAANEAIQRLHRALRAALAATNEAEAEYDRLSKAKHVATVKRKNLERIKHAENVVKSANELGKHWAAFWRSSGSLAPILPAEIANKGGTMMRAFEAIDAFARQLAKSNPSEPTMPDQVPSFPEPARFIGNPEKIVDFAEEVRKASEHIIRLMTEVKVAPQPEPVVATPVVSADEVKVEKVNLNGQAPAEQPGRTYTAAEARPRIDLSTLPVE